MIDLSFSWCLLVIEVGFCLCFYSLIVKSLVAVRPCCPSRGLRLSGLVLEFDLSATLVRPLPLHLSFHVSLELLF